MQDVVLEDMGRAGCCITCLARWAGIEVQLPKLWPRSTLSTLFSQVSIQLLSVLCICVCLCRCMCLCVYVCVYVCMCLLVAAMANIHGAETVFSGGFWACMPETTHSAETAATVCKSVCMSVCLHVCLYVCTFVCQDA